MGKGTELGEHVVHSLLGIGNAGICPGEGKLRTLRSGTLEYACLPLGRQASFEVEMKDWGYCL